MFKNWTNGLSRRSVSSLIHQNNVPSEDLNELEKVKSFVVSTITLSKAIDQLELDDCNKSDEEYLSIYREKLRNGILKKITITTVSQ